MYNVCNDANVYDRNRAAGIEEKGDDELNSVRLIKLSPRADIVFYFAADTRAKKLGRDRDTTAYRPVITCA